MSMPSNIAAARPINTAVEDSTEFDYSALPRDVADQARAAADKIKKLLHAGFIEVGRVLRDIKDRLEHGQFGCWVGAELGMTERAAQRFIRGADLADNFPDLSKLAPKMIHALAAPSIPPEVVAEILTKVEAGGKPTIDEVAVRVARTKEDKRKAARRRKKTLDQVKQEEEAQARHQKRREAKERKQKEQADHEEQERVTRLHPLAERISKAVDAQDFSALVAILSGHNYNDRYTLLRLLTKLQGPTETPTGGHTDSDHATADALDLPQATEAAA